MDDSCKEKVNSIIKEIAHIQVELKKIDDIYMGAKDDYWKAIRKLDEVWYLLNDTVNK